MNSTRMWGLVILYTLFVLAAVIFGVVVMVVTR